MRPEIKEALDVAFRSDETTNTCIKVARLFTKDPAPRTLVSVAKKIEDSEGLTLLTLDRLLHEARILDYFPEFSDTAPQITYKYKVKDEYLEHLQEYAAPAV